jgi:hypothetical protein
MFICNIDLRANLLPASFEPLLRHLRGEIWVVPVLVAAGCLTVVLLVFEIYLIAHVVRSTRRHQVQDSHVLAHQINI